MGKVKTLGRDRRPVKTVIDIGNKNIRCAIGRRTGRGDIEILGIGQVPTRGIRNGLIVARDALENALCAAVKEAQLETGESVRDVALAISSANIEFTRIEAQIACDSTALTRNDVDRVTKTALGLYRDAIEEDRTAIGFYPSIWTVDDNPVDEPIGLVGDRLALNGLFVSVPSALVLSYRRIVQSLDLKLTRLRPAHACAAWGIHDEACDFPLVVVDFGSEYTKIAYLEGGRLLFIDTIPLGSDQITRDLAYELDITSERAEEIKITQASLASLDPSALASSGDEIRVGTLRQRAAIQAVLQPRIDAVLADVRARLPADLVEARPGTRIAITGAGARLPGLPSHVATLLEKPARLCAPTCLAASAEGLAMPENATLVGLLRMELGEDPDIMGATKATRQSLFDRLMGFLLRDL